MCDEKMRMRNVFFFKDMELVVTVSMRNILRRSRFQVRKSEKPQQLEFATDCGLFCTCTYVAVVL